MGEHAALNADLLQRALAESRRRLGGLDSDAERQRRQEALRHIEGYAELLREPAVAVMQREPVRYCFKLVFPDGSWSVGEKQLAGRPHEGDVVLFDGYGGWRVEASQTVRVRPAGKPPRELFVCAPAA